MKHTITILFTKILKIYKYQCANFDTMATNGVNYNNKNSVYFEIKFTIQNYTI